MEGVTIYGWIVEHISLPMILYDLKRVTGHRLVHAELVGEGPLAPTQLERRRAIEFWNSSGALLGSITCWSLQCLRYSNPHDVRLLFDLNRVLKQSTTRCIFDWEEPDGQEFILPDEQSLWE